MRLLEFIGGPGAGKSTMAAYAYYRFKKAGIRAELVGEAAREIIYNHDPKTTAPQLLDNQLLLSGAQYERLKRLERHGCQLAISDSPLVAGLAYAKGLPEYEGLRQAVEQIAYQWPTKIVKIMRTVGIYDKESRAQTEEEAIALDKVIDELVPGINTYLYWGEEAHLLDIMIEQFKENYA